MAGGTYMYGDSTKWKIIPLSAIQMVWDSIVDDAFIQFDLLEKGSAWSFKAITEDNDRGGKTIVGFEFLCNIIVPDTNYEDMIPALKWMSEYHPGFVLYLSLASEEHQPAGAVMLVGQPVIDGINVQDYSIVWNIEGKELSPNLTIEITGVLSLDVLDTISPFFVQGVL